LSVAAPPAGGWATAIGDATVSKTRAARCPGAWLTFHAADPGWRIPAPAARCSVAATGSVRMGDAIGDGPLFKARAFIRRAGARRSTRWPLNA